MNKAWMGWFSAVLFLIGGILLLVAGKIVAGILLILASVASVILQLKMRNLHKK
jgi:hypothetical protein